MFFKNTGKNNESIKDSIPLKLPDLEIANNSIKRTSSTNF